MAESSMKHQQQYDNALLEASKNRQHEVRFLVF